MNTSLPKPSAPQPQVGAPTSGGPTVATPSATPTTPAPAQSPQPPAPTPPKPPTAQPPQAPQQGGGSAPAQVPTPSAGQPQGLPPKSLSALSSMNSTQIPKNNVTAIPTDPSVQAKQPAGSAPSAMPPAPPKAMAGPGSAPPKPGDASTPPGDAGKPPEKAGNKPKFASVERPMAKYAIIGAIVLVVLGIIGGIAYMFLGRGSDSAGSGSTSRTPTSQTGGSTREVVPGEETTIEYWGLWEPTEVMEEVIAEFETANPGITVSYSKQSHLNYRERLQTAISSGNGPDVFRFHASWVPMLLGELQPIPNSVMSAAEFKTTYYPAATKQLQANGQYVGIPMMYDGLALLYNKEMFNTAGLQVPSTWAGVKEAAARLAIKGSDGSLSRGGIALGNAENVDHFSDILGLLMLQNGAILSEADSQEVADALSFYTSFQLTDGVWNSELPSSTTAFAREEVAMIIVPSWRIHEILAQNPDLDFGVTNAPVIEDRLTWATYWAEGINSKSDKQEAAAAFLKFITQKETLEKFYDAASQVRAFGELYPRMDMASEIADNEYVAPYLDDAPYSQGWYMSSFTHDNGINDQIIKYYEDAVNAMVLNGDKAPKVQTTLDQGVSQVLRQYGVSGALAR